MARDLDVVRAVTGLRVRTRRARSGARACCVFFDAHAPRSRSRPPPRRPSPSPTTALSSHPTPPHRPLLLPASSSSPPLLALPSLSFSPVYAGAAGGAGAPLGGGAAPLGGGAWAAPSAPAATVGKPPGASPPSSCSRHHPRQPPASREQARAGTHRHGAAGRAGSGG
eukprot:479800-Rhodomonas_salina.1